MLITTKTVHYLGQALSDKRTQVHLKSLKIKESKLYPSTVSVAADEDSCSCGFHKVAVSRTFHLKEYPAERGLTVRHCEPSKVTQNKNIYSKPKDGTTPTYISS